MRKWMKGFAVTGVILLLTGTAVTALAAVAGNLTYGRGGFRYWTNDFFEGEVLGQIGDVVIRDSQICSKEEMKLVGSFEKITKIEIESRRAAVKIVENGELTDEIRVYLKEDRNAGIATENDEAGELKIQYSWLRRRGGGYTQGIVEVPAGYRFREVELEAKAGMLTVQRIAADELDVSVQAAEVNLDHFDAGNADFTVAAGNLTAIGAIERRLETEAKAGSITVELAGNEKDYNYELENAVGSTVIGGSGYSGLSRDKSINYGADKTVLVDCAAGSVEILFTGDED